MNYNIIGDIHGRDTWKQLVREDCLNIFLGDYLDPYPGEGITDDMAWQNFTDLLRYREEHPENIVLLIGNHDLHYLFADEHYSRFCSANADRMKELYALGKFDNMLLGCVVAENTLITHAGVTREWWQMVCRLMHRELEATPKHIAGVLKMIKEKGPLLMEKVLGVEYTFLPGDFYGDSPTASPIWVRPETLLSHNVFAGTDYKQVVGHTQIAEPLTVGNITFVDCLGHNPASYEV